MSIDGTNGNPSGPSGLPGGNVGRLPGQGGLPGLNRIHQGPQGVQEGVSAEGENVAAQAGEEAVALFSRPNPRDWMSQVVSRVRDLVPSGIPDADPDGDQDIATLLGRFGPNVAEKLKRSVTSLSTYLDIARRFNSPPQDKPAQNTTTSASGQTGPAQSEANEALSNVQDSVAGAITELVSSGFKGGDVMAYVQWVMRESYVENTNMLRDYALKVEYYNNKKKALRNLLKTLRDMRENMPEVPEEERGNTDLAGNATEGAGTSGGTTLGAPAGVQVDPQYATVPEQSTRDTDISAKIAKWTSFGRAKLEEYFKSNDAADLHELLELIPHMTAEEIAKVLYAFGGNDGNVVNSLRYIWGDIAAKMSTDQLLEFTQTSLYKNKELYERELKAAFDPAIAEARARAASEIGCSVGNVTPERWAAHCQAKYDEAVAAAAAAQSGAQGGVSGAATLGTPEGVQADPRYAAVPDPSTRNPEISAAISRWTSFGRAKLEDHFKANKGADLQELLELIPHMTAEEIAKVLYAFGGNDGNVVDSLRYIWGEIAAKMSTSQLLAFTQTPLYKNKELYERELKATFDPVIAAVKTMAAHDMGCTVEVVTPEGWAAHCQAKYDEAVAAAEVDPQAAPEAPRIATQEEAQGSGVEANVPSEALDFDATDGQIDRIIVTGSGGPPYFVKDPDGGKVSTCEGFDNLVKDIEAALETAGEDGQLANVDLQNMMQKQQQTLQIMTQISKMLHDTAMAIIRKISS